MNKNLLCIALAVTMIPVHNHAAPQSGMTASGILSVMPSPVPEMNAAKSTGTWRVRKSKEVSPFITGGPTVRPAKTDKVPTWHAPMADPRDIEGIDRLFGYMLFSTKWGIGNNEYGLYNVPLNTGAFTPISLNVRSGGGGFDNGEGLYYSVENINFFGSDLYLLNTYSTDTWEELSSFNVTGRISATDVALDPVTGNVYGCYNNDDMTGFVWGIGNYETGERTAIADIPQLYGVAINNEGDAYGITYDNYLIKINKHTGTYAVIGQTGLTNYYLTSAAIDQRSGRMFFTYNPEDETGWLTEIDLKTGAATKLLRFNGDAEILNLQFPVMLADDKAPAAPTLTAVCPDGNKYADIVLTAPTQLYDGTETSGRLSYRILSNGVLRKQGTIECGASVSTRINVTDAGWYTFTATVSNSAGESPKAREKVFIGNGTPAAPSAVTLTDNGSDFTLSWAPVNSSQDGGYFDPSEVSYTVYSADSVAIRSAVSDTAIVIPHEPFTDLQAVTYLVSAEYYGYSSSLTKSNVLIVGADNPPVYAGLDSSDDAEYFTIIDNNNDRATWSYHPGTHAMMAPYTTNHDMDDYLISMPIRLKAGMAYEVSINAFCHRLDYGTEAVELMYGTAPTAAAMINTLIPPTVVNSTYYDPQTLTGTLIPEADGIYYIGIHGISPKNRYILYVNHFSVAAGLSSGAPASPEDVVLTPDPDGGLTGKLTLKAPASSINGIPLTGLNTLEIETDDLHSSISNPTPGEEYTFDITVPEMGVYTVRAFATNADGKGEIAEVSAYFGLNNPSAPLNVRITESPAIGDVTLTWDATTTDVEGNSISGCKYNVYYYVGEDRITQATGLTETTLTIEDFVPEGEQQFVQFYVCAERGGLESDAKASPIIAVGTPYPTPFKFSFTNDDFRKYPIKTNTTGKASWAIATSASLGIEAQDGDDVFGVVTASYIGYYATLCTGKISLDNLRKPIITVWEYKINEEDTNMTSISVICDGEETTVLSTSNQQAPVEYGWYAHQVDISQYAGKVIEIGLTGTIQSHIYSIYDNISVTEALEYDLAVQSIEAPEAVNPYEEFEIKVTIKNIGIKDVTNDFEVMWFKDDDEVEVDVIHGLSSGEEMTLTLSQELTLYDWTVTDYRAMIVCAEDRNTDNNTSGVVSVELNEMEFPRVTSIRGETVSNGFLISWDAPKGLTDDLQITGYSVLQVDGNRYNEIGKVSATTTQYLVANPSAKAQYCVQVIYDRGKSDYSPILQYDSSIETVGADNATVSVDGHSIVVDGADDLAVTIFTADGIPVAASKGDIRIAVTRGVYLVTVGNAVTKVAVP